MPEVLLSNIIPTQREYDECAQIRPITAIKAVRSLTGLGLRESKAVVDRLREGTPQTIYVDVFQANRDGAVLTDAGLLWTLLHKADPQTRRDAVRQFLGDLPRDLTVGDILYVLDAEDRL